jgi:hypothetical protein
MSAVVQAPRELVEAVAELRLPTKANKRLQTLMDRNTDGTLSPEEREELETLVELSETIALVRAPALRGTPLEMWGNLSNKLSGPPGGRGAHEVRWRRSGRKVQCPGVEPLARTGVEVR